MNKITDGTASFIVRKIGGGGQLIKGIIMAFSGTFDNGFPVNPDTNTADAGWHICDGTHDTPDLRGKFILGASSNHTAGSAGGEETHVLTVGELPRFTPSITVSILDGNPNSANMWHQRRNCVAGGCDDPRLTSAPFSSIGGDQPHNNMPPYYALSYIMKI